MILRGDSAELGDLRLTLSTNPNLRAQLPVLALVDPTNDECDAEDEFGDVVTEGISQTLQSDSLQSGSEITSEDIGYTAKTQPHKRTRDGAEDDSDLGDDEEDDNEKLLLYVPSVRCTCSSWEMEDVAGELFITSLRVLFLAEKVKEGEEPLNDVAIAGRCIALHAVDSLPSSDDDNEAGISHHIYCQLAEPMEDDGEVGFTPSMSMFAPSAIVDEENETFYNNDDNEEVGDDDNGSSENAGTVELYFKPATNDGDDERESQSNACQIIFDVLTKLVSLNPEEESDGGFNGGGGGLFSMLSLMAGIGNQSDGADIGMVFANDEEDDDNMVVRLGGSNNIVANDDDSVGVSNEDRQAMLRRLDAMLVVPPEYEIASSNDGQFDDADEDDDDDDEIL